MSGNKRTRLSPEGRRNQLLDTARDLLLKKGFSGFTMDTLAFEAGVSNPLIYKYFDTLWQWAYRYAIRTRTYL